MTRPVCAVAVFVLIWPALWTAEAATLKVSPARFIVHNVEPGRLYDVYKETGLRLTIYNEDDAPRTWVLSTHRPSERGRWERGYAEIPDASWCWFEENEITVEPNGKGYANLHLKAPDKEQYYNQHWVATLGVGGKPGSSGIALAVDVRVQIETKTKANMGVAPYGAFGVAPSIVRFENVVPGQSERSSAVLYNNDEMAHVYAMSPLPTEDEDARRTYLTSGYESLPDPRWVAYERSVPIERHDRETLVIEVHVPENAAHFGRKWEEVLFIEPNAGRAGFLRVQIETVEAPPEPSQDSTEQ